MAMNLLDFSNALAEVIDRSAQGMVRVDARRRFPASGLVWSADGMIVTANHVIEDEDDIQVSFQADQNLQAELVGRDPSTDLALLRVQNTGLTVLKRSDINQLKVGHLAVAIGRTGKRPRATLGIIQVLGDSWRTPPGGVIDHYIQPGIEMLPGFSGGTLIDLSGSLIGLNTSGLTREGNLTIPHTTVERVVNQLKDFGHVRRGYLGIGTQPVRIPDVHVQGLKQETGLLVVSVEPGSPADTGGLLLGDTLVRFGNEPVRYMDDLVTRLSGSGQIGQAVQLQVIRAGQVIPIQITLGEK